MKYNSFGCVINDLYRNADFRRTIMNSSEALEDLLDRMELFYLHDGLTADGLLSFYMFSDEGRHVINYVAREHDIDVVELEAELFALEPFIDTALKLAGIHPKSRVHWTLLEEEE